MGRLLTAFLKLGLAAIMLAIIAGIAWLIYREIDRSFDSVVTRVEANTRRIELAEDDINAFAVSNGARQEELQELQAAIATRDAAIEALEATLAGEQARRDVDLGALQSQFEDLVARTETMTASLAFLNDGLINLQGDITANVSELDALGGAVDSLQAEVTGQGDVIAALRSETDAFSAEEFARMQQAIALFRVWEMVSRAKLRLLEQNIGLAATDVDSALASVDVIVLALPAEGVQATGLAEVRQRLVQASSNLPDDAAAASRDLETAWELLDDLLATLLDGEALQSSPDANPVPTPAATPAS